MWAWREWSASSGVLEPVGFLTASAEHERAELALEGASRAAEMWKRPVRGTRACGVWGDRDGWSLERNLGGNCHFGVICILIIYSYELGELTQKVRGKGIGKEGAEAEPWPRNAKNREEFAPSKEVEKKQSLGRGLFPWRPVRKLYVCRGVTGCFT